MSAVSPLKWYLIAITAAAFDQTTKLAVLHLMPLGDSIPITGFFNFVHARNTGAAFSFLANAGGWQRYFLAATALAISAWIAVMLRRRLPTAEARAFALILGGALGNVADRIAKGHVVDFLDFHWNGMHWPAFNFADVCITAGVTLLITGVGRSSSNTEQQPGAR